MAGRGRGRGRGLLSTSPVVPGARGNEEERPKEEEEKNPPSQTSEPAQNEKVSEPEVKSKINPRGEPTMAEVEGLLGDMCLDLEERDIENVSNLAEEAVKTGDDLEALARHIYNKSLSDHSFAKNASILSNRLSNMEREGKKFRNNLLSIVQSDFKVKEKLQEEENSRFVGFVTFLCNIYANMRTANGDRFQPLIPPIFDLFNLIIVNVDPKTSSDECECLALQLSLVGKFLDQANSEALQNLMEQIRLRIISNSSSPSVRCQLLEIVEAYGRGWEEASQEVQRFYLDTMADVLTEIIL